jgi:hypothetical protein
MYDGNAFIPSAFAVLTSMYRRLIRMICILPHIYRFFRYSHENDTLRSYQGMGRASREGKPIPEEVREVLISTQQNDSSHDFHVEPTTAKVRVSKEQVKRILTVRNR